MEQSAARRFYVVINPNSGTVLATGITAEVLEEHFAAAGLEAIVDADSETPFAERIERAVNADVDVVVAAGGDGTITALAGALAGTDKTLAILPLGTVNALAKDLGLPMDVPEAIAMLRSAQVRKIDVGEVNGRVYLHKVVIGVIPSLAAAREHIRGQGTWSSKFAFMRFLVHRLLRSRRMALAIEPEDGESHIVRVKAVAVACNSYDQGLGKIFSRENLQGGELYIYTLSTLTIADFVRLSAGMVLGNWQESEALNIETSKAVTIRTRKKLVKVMFDGEVESLHTPLEFRIRPAALSVLVPPDEEEAVEAAQ
jgi:diacylglycerol kinase family enzyme